MITPVGRAGRRTVRESACRTSTSRGAAERGELAQAAHRVGRVPDEELPRLVDRPALALVLLAVVRRGHRASAGSRGRSASSAAPSARRARGSRARRRGTAPAASLDRRAVGEQLLERPRRVPARRATASTRPRVAVASRRVLQRAAQRELELAGEYSAVLTRASRQLNAEMSQPTASAPKTFASTSVVPEPANGS